MNQNTEPEILPEMTQETAMLIEYFCKELGYIKETAPEEGDKSRFMGFSIDL